MSNTKTVTVHETNAVVLPLDELIAITSYPNWKGAEGAVPIVMHLPGTQAQRSLEFYARLLCEGNAKIVEMDDTRTVIEAGNGNYACTIVIEWATEAQITHAYERGNVRCDRWYRTVSVTI